MSLLVLGGKNESFYYCKFSSSSSVYSFMVQILYLSLINNRHLYFTATPLKNFMKRHVSGAFLFDSLRFGCFLVKRSRTGLVFTPELLIIFLLL